MNENESPNPVRRKLRQSKLVFTEKGITIDYKPQKNCSKHKMSTKRLKKEPIKDKIVENVDIVDSPPKVDPRLEDMANDAIQPTDLIQDFSNSELTFEVIDNLIDDCSDNNPTIKALITIDKLRDECTSLGLVLNDQFVDECSSDEESDYCTNSTNGANFEVESIYDSRLDSDRLTSYWVKWKNYDKEYNTWEPLSNLKNCIKLVQEFRHIKSHNLDLMEAYRNYYRIKGIIEDMVERKVAFDVLMTILLAFNDIRLKDFNYTKALANKMRNDLRDKHLAQMDHISGITNVDLRVQKIAIQYNQLIEELNIDKHFKSFDQFSEFFTKRKQSEFRLNNWEHQVNCIIKQANEGQTISVENLVDCEIPPLNFEYISRCRTADPSIVICNDPPLFCHCDDCATESSDCCVASNQSKIYYTRNGLLKDSRNQRIPIYECNNRCTCTQNCINRVVQKGRKHKLAIFRTDDGKGWGVRALEPIQKGSYVMEYVGEIISVDEADRRGHIYDAEGRTYLFDLDYTSDEIAKYTLDATQCGNVSHFVNHSCDPNLDTKVVWINNLDPFMPHISLFAVRNIRLNEELTFDYRISVHGITDAEQSQSTVSSDKSYDSGIDGSTSEAKPIRVSCHCGADNCRKFLY